MKKFSSASIEQKARVPAHWVAPDWDFPLCPQSSRRTAVTQRSQRPRAAASPSRSICQSSSPKNARRRKLTEFNVRCFLPEPNVLRISTIKAPPFFLENDAENRWELSDHALHGLCESFALGEAPCQALKKWLALPSNIVRLGVSAHGCRCTSVAF